MVTMSLQFSDMSGFYTFRFMGYAVPSEVFAREEDCWYVNSAGYVQRYDENRPPSMLPTSVGGVRLIVTPLYGAKENSNG